VTRGLCGAAYVTTVFTAIPAMGAAVVVGLTVAGKQVASVFFDQLGPDAHAQEARDPSEALGRLPDPSPVGARRFVRRTILEKGNV
jgi:uncharacterized membrane protein YdcZ (DUF606 family)